MNAGADYIPYCHVSPLLVTGLHPTLFQNDGECLRNYMCRRFEPCLPRVSKAVAQLVEQFLKTLVAVAFTLNPQTNPGECRS